MLGGSKTHHGNCYLTLIISHSQIHPRLVPWLLPLAQISLTGSSATILAIAVERLNCILRPHMETSNKKSLTICLSIVGFSIVVNLNRFFEYSTEVVCKVR